MKQSPNHSLNSNFLLSKVKNGRRNKNVRKLIHSTLA